MKKKFFHKCVILLGLFLFLILLTPSMKADASTVEMGKNEDYRLNFKSAAIVKGKTFPLSLKVFNLSENVKVSFKSDDQEIASVSEEGVITANKVGNTTITAIFKVDITETTLTCDVLVGPPAFSVKITKSRIIIGLGNTDFLNVILKPSNTFEDAKFSSLNSSIVYVSPGGRIAAKSIGLTYVFAEIDALNVDGIRKFSTCTVIVTNLEDAPLLEAYFIDHPELDLIAEAELTKALDEFFNIKYSSTATTSLVNSLNSYLNDKFDLAELRKAREANQSKIQNNSVEVGSGTTIG